MKIALSQINTATGDLAHNAGKMIKTIAQAKGESIDLLVFAELSLPGYPPKDFLFEQGWLTKQQQYINQIIEASSNLHVIFGCIDASEERWYNAALWVDKKGKISKQYKRLLPNDDVFDEKRYFSAGQTQDVWLIEDQRIAVSICEDMWAPHVAHDKIDPIADLARQNPSLMINLSASPFVAGKDQMRKQLVQHHVQAYGCPFLYVNLVGGNDELVFDGGSFVSDGHGHVFMQARSFEEDVLIYDTEHRQLDIAAYPDSLLEQKKQAMVLGLQDFFWKNGFEKAVLGLSGGIDSAVVSALAVEALGAANVITVFMPTQYTRDISHHDAKLLAQHLGTTWMEMSIDGLKEQVHDSIETALPSSAQSLTLENVQARLRGLLLMAVSSETGALVLQTGNKSEMALGYCTLYGDMVGAISPIGDLYKHEVYAIGELLNQDGAGIPQRVFDRAPSAELKADQQDTDTLPPYGVVDPIVQMCIEQGKNVDQMVQEGFDRELVEKLYRSIGNQEFKRKQAPPIIKLSRKAFGSGRRMAIAKRGHAN